MRVLGRGRELQGRRGGVGANLADGVQVARRRGREFKCGREFNLRGGAVFWCVCWGVGANLDLLIFFVAIPARLF